MSKKKVILFSLIFALTASFGGNIATPMADTIKEQKAQKKKLEKKRAKEAEKIEKLKAQKVEIEDAIKKLDEKKEVIELNISDYNTRIDKMEKTIAKVEVEINGESDYLDIILGAKSVEDLLNQGEYMAKISDYDNTLLDRYKEAKRIAKEKKVEKEEKLAELNMTLSELEVKKAENERLAEAKGVQIEKFAALIKEAGNKVSEYDLEIGKKEQYIDKLIAAAEKADRERREREAREAAARLANQSNQTGQIVTGKASASGMIWPMPYSTRITSGFGYRSEVMFGSGTFHNGIDIAVNAGTPIIAAKAGRVIGAGYHYSMGNHVIIDHGGGVYTVYMHASKLLVSVGQEVSRGETIALVGSTGMSTGPHLHFSVKINGAYVNPLKYVSP